MINRIAIVSLALALIAAFAASPRPSAAQQAAAGPASAPATRATDPRAMAVLQMLEKADYTALECDLNYTVLNRKLGDTEVRTGNVLYQKESGDKGAMFRVNFRTLAQGKGPAAKEEVDYAFDGRWFCLARGRTKTINCVEVVAEGEKPQPLKLGKSPFPMPFGQQAADVVKLFDATTRELRTGEPAGTIYLRLMPRADQAKNLSFTRLEMWIDPARNLPVKIVSLDHARNEVTALFNNIKILDTPIKDSTFRIGRRAGWNYTEETLKDAQKKEPK
ncbi:MAG: hypothetical protein ABFD92_14130 [Planctomycetaceae bacterium]|nr:hypothetical protein [Planctomycetaceae bacterium]